MKRLLPSVVSTCCPSDQQGIAATTSLIVVGNGDGQECLPELAHIAAADARIEGLTALIDALAIGDAGKVTTALALPDNPGLSWPSKLEAAQPETLAVLEAHLQRFMDEYPTNGASEPVKELLQQCNSLVQPKQACRKLVPCWDAARRELSVDGQLVKRFRVRARNQEAILAAFQEERWPWRIDDPLRRRGDLDSKVRLNNTVKALNRHRLAMVIWFSCDGSGRGVVWQLLPNW